MRWKPIATAKKAVNVNVMDTDLRLITNNFTHEERMMHRIRAMYRDLESGDGDVKYVNDILSALHDYLIQYDDEDIMMSTFKIKEAIFYVAHFLES